MKDISQVNHRKLVYCILKKVTNESLKHCRGIAKDKGHGSEFKMTISGSKHGLPFIES